MKKKLLFTYITLFLLVLTAACAASAFDGSRTGNETQFLLDFKALNETETHPMPLKEGDIVNVAVLREAGRLDITVTDESGNEIYRGNDASSGSFALEIKADSTYTFTVEGKKAKGSVHFIVKK